METSEQAPSFFNHGLTVLGGVVAVGSWLFLLFGVGADSGYGGAVANLHKIAMAQSGILTGGVLFLSGVAASVGDALSLKRRPDAETVGSVE